MVNVIDNCINACFNYEMLVNGCVHCDSVIGIMTA